MLAELGPRYHWTAHAKDLLIESRLALHFDETVCGDGVLDWPAYLRCAERLGTTERPAAVLVEHMPAFLAPRGLAVPPGTGQLRRRLESFTGSPERLATRPEPGVETLLPLLRACRGPARSSAPGSTARRRPRCRCWALGFRAGVGGS